MRYKYFYKRLSKYALCPNSQRFQLTYLNNALSLSVSNNERKTITTRAFHAVKVFRINPNYLNKLDIYITLEFNIKAFLKKLLDTLPDFSKSLVKLLFLKSSWIIEYLHERNYYIYINHFLEIMGRLNSEYYWVLN